jgi:hypothetical protein
MMKRSQSKGPGDAPKPRKTLQRKTVRDLKTGDAAERIKGGRWNPSGG